MSSAGIRALELSRALSRHFDVAIEPVAGGRLDDYDAVVAHALPPRAARRLARSTTRVVYDLYIPALTETLAAAQVDASRRRRLLGRAGVLGQELALATGDAFVCASERQRDLWLGMLAELGRLDERLHAEDPSLRNLVDVVPFGIPERPPERAPALRCVVRGLDDSDRILLWAGGVVDWLDPGTPIRALELLDPNVKLVFLSRSPDTRTLRRAVELARERKLLDRRVFFLGGWIPYERRGAYLLDADVGVCAHRDTLEARFAFRTRLVDHVWAGVPTVTSAGEALGDLIEAHGLGRTIAPGDTQGFAAALAEQLEAPPPVESFEPLRTQLSWTRSAEPLRRLLEGGRAPAPKRVANTRLRLAGVRAALSARARLGRRAEMRATPSGDDAHR